MSIQDVIDHIFHFDPPGSAFTKAFERALTPLSLPENYVLLEAPKISDHIYFLENGFAMTYRYLGAVRFVETFWKQGQAIVSFESFLGQSPSLEYIQLITKCDLLCLSYNDFQRLLKNHTEAQVVQQSVFTLAYSKAVSRYHDHLRLSSETRHTNLLREYPGIEQVVAQENIASFLGITPQSLSRIKRKIRNALTENTQDHEQLPQ